MNYGQYIFGLELNNPNSQIALSAKTTDTGRKLYINLTQDGEPYVITDDCWVLFMATKSDGTKIVHECSVVNNVVEYELQEQTVASVGVMNCAIAVYGNVNNVAKKLESAMFNMVVYNNAIDVDEVISSDDYQAFISATGELKKLMAECEEQLQTYASQLSTINNSLNLLSRRNAVELTDTIGYYVTTVDDVRYVWQPNYRSLEITSTNNEATAYEFSTFDLSSPMLKGQKVTLEATCTQGISVRYTLEKYSGATQSLNLDTPTRIIDTSLFKSVKIEVLKAEGVTGTSYAKIKLRTGLSHTELQQMITNNQKAIEKIDKQLKEGGGVGEDGKSAYEIWLAEGNTGEVEDFLASLKGEQGEQGEQGEKGEQGEQGEKGEKGEDGTSITITGTEHIVSVGLPTTHIITFSDGTTLSITDGERGATGTRGPNGESVIITNIELSEEDGGENKVTFSEEGGLMSVLVVRNGRRGSTPVKGEDYFTDEDKAEFTNEICNEVIAEAKAYTDEEIAKFDFIKVVDSLPTTGLPNKVYLVPKTDTQTQDLFDEYAWVNKGTEENPQYVWEWITTKQLEVDLTSYTTIDKVEAMLLERSKKEHPVGSLYLSMTNNYPGAFLGFGTWQLIAENQFPIGAGDKYEAGATGGREIHAHNVAMHFSSYYSSMQMEKNSETGLVIYDEEGNKTPTGSAIRSTSPRYAKVNFNGGTEGSSKEIEAAVYETEGLTSYTSNMPPYIAVYMWQRIA